MPKIAIFVDVQNIYYTVKEAFGCHFNYRELWRQVSLEGDIVLANAYAIDRNNAQQRNFQETLRNIGFDIKLKPYIQRSDGSAKGDWDVGIAIDVMEFAPQSDIVVLASGDGDFDLLIKKIRTKFNTESEVYGVPELTAASLKAEATMFKAIDDKFLLR